MLLLHTWLVWRRCCDCKFSLRRSFNRQGQDNQLYNWLEHVPMLRKSNNRTERLWDMSNLKENEMWFLVLYDFVQGIMFLSWYLFAYYLHNKDYKQARYKIKEISTLHCEYPTEREIILPVSLSLYSLQSVNCPLPYTKKIAYILPKRKLLSLGFSYCCDICFKWHFYYVFFSLFAMSYATKEVVDNFILQPQNYLV